jgi:hypothetical protein
MNGRILFFHVVLGAFAIAALACVDGHVLAAAQGDGGDRFDTPTRPQFVLGERAFAATSSWNTPIAADAIYSPVHWPFSAHYGVAWSSYSPAIFVAKDSDPLVAVAYPPSWGYRGGTLHVRMPIEADGAPGTDGELLVIERDVVHNFWQFKRHGPVTASARSYGAANLKTGSGWGHKSPFLSAGIVAAGSSQLAGLLIQAETDRGEIEHALQIAVESSLARPGAVGEAINSDGKNPRGIVQEAERLGIPPDVSPPSGLSSLGKKVFRAYQKYGAFVIDVAGGVTNLRAQANAYDRATIAALQRDLVKITPMLERVQQTRRSSDRK